MGDNGSQPMDTQAMARAWQMNAEVQREVVMHLKSNEGAIVAMVSNNTCMRKTMLLVVALMAMACSFVAWSTVVIGEQSATVLESAETVSTRLTTIEDQQRVVLGVVNSAIEADHAAEELRDAERQLALKLLTTNRNRRKPQTVKETELVKAKTRVMRQKRLDAREAATKARDQFKIH